MCKKKKEKKELNYLFNILIQFGRVMKNQSDKITLYSFCAVKEGPGSPGLQTTTLGVNA